ncbi:MAG: 2-oxoisovalerate dehydrogenase [Legionellales bacterium RIFCSPHIGHO2_12_FULL_35_11]|nr:MAG: 2-oxoisovalerate dehydrogenase [Legionellales bacterium RIFCSPHIGHO2_12_FULL_35_11]
MANLNLAQAVTQALAYELANDENVVVFGEDVGKNGGVFRITEGLQDRFGEKRVFDTPLAESMIAGLAIGMSTQGLKPIAEFQFMGFIYPALNQIISHAARMRNRTRGRLSCPLVFRAPFGGGIRAPEHHSESTEALFAHIPGLQVVIPSSPKRAYGLLLAAIRNPDPVIFLEPKRIYRLVKQPVEDDGQALPLGKCFTLQEGDDITLISWGASLHETMQAAKALHEDGVSCEIIDVASIKPLDIETIIQSVQKTGRCVIIHEGAKTCGVGAEISALLMEHCLTDLLAPVIRVTGYDVVMPYFQLEKEYLPSVARIKESILSILE